MRVCQLAHATDDIMAMLSFQSVPAVASYDAVIITKLNATWYVPAPRTAAHMVRPQRAETPLQIPRF